MSLLPEAPSRSPRSAEDRRGRVPVRVPRLHCCAALPILVAALGPPAPETVELDGARFRELRAAAVAEDTSPAPGPALASREITLRPATDGLRLFGTWRVETERPGFVSGMLTGAGIEIERVTIGGRTAPILRSPAGAWLFVRVDRSATIVVEAFVPVTAGEPIELDLLPASRGRLTLDDPEHVAVPVDPKDGPTAGFARVGPAIVGGARRLALEVHERGATPPPRGPLAEAHAALGVTIGDAEIRGRARLKWEVLRGSLDGVRATVHGLGDDLTLAGENVEAWRRAGDEIEIDLRTPASGRVDVEVEWTRATPSGGQSRVSLPTIAPAAWHADATLQIARDGEIEVVPELDAWDAIASSELPEWGQGLVEGTPTATYRTASADRAGGKLELLRFEPVPGPAVVVDVAATTVATTQEGRLLARAHYEVRNERAAHLRITPPKGVRIIGARVAGETARPARAEGGAWLVPLERSLETVDGLLSFPVEVVLMGEGEPWDRRERRALALPILDAPIAASRVTLILPPEYSSRQGPGDGTVVDAFTEGEGIAYGLGIGAVGVAHADAAFQDAVQAYLAGDFHRAQARLDELRGMGAHNENTRRLQANLDVLEGKDRDEDAIADSSDTAAPKAQAVLGRRIRDQARARASEDYRRQESLQEQAETLQAEGDYEEAEKKLSEAVVIGGKLEKLDQAESVEQRKKNVEIRTSLRAVRIAKVKRKSRWSPRRPRSIGTTAKRPAAGPTSVDTPAAVTPDDAPMLASADTLPPPVATASAVSVIVPTVGQSVLYQELLIEAGRAPSIAIDARRRLRRPQRRR